MGMQRRPSRDKVLHWHWQRNDAGSYSRGNKSARTRLANGFRLQAGTGTIPELPAPRCGNSRSPAIRYVLAVASTTLAMDADPRAPLPSPRPRSVRRSRRATCRSPRRHPVARQSRRPTSIARPSFGSGEMLRIPSSFSYTSITIGSSPLRRITSWRRWKSNQRSLRRYCQPVAPPGRQSSTKNRSCRMHVLTPHARFRERPTAMIGHPEVSPHAYAPLPQLSATSYQIAGSRLTSKCGSEANKAWPVALRAGLTAKHCCGQPRQIARTSNVSSESRLAIRISRSGSKSMPSK